MAREIGSKSSYVRRLIHGFELFAKIRESKYYGLELEEENFDLSPITDAVLNYSFIAEYINYNATLENPLTQVNETKFKEVVEWLYKTDEKGRTRVGETRNLRVLNKVMQVERARKAFIEEKKSLKEAAELTDILDESIREFLTRAYNNLLEAQKQAHLSNNPTKDDLELLENVISSADFILSRLKKVIQNKTMN